jgi:GDPmannose 4,6-dehydratase
MATRSALITGVAGQDGSYLAELLLAKGYDVHGLFRPAQRAGCLPPGTASEVKRHEGDISSVDDVIAAVRAAQPDECYHLAAESHVVGEEFATMRTNVSGTHHVLSAVHSHAPQCRVFVAGSAEIFGAAEHAPQNEQTPMRPRSIYGISKVTALLLLRHYRERMGLYAACGILFNHESPRRGERFVTRKITRAAVRIKAGLQRELRLGNLDAIRDWGDARDYVEAMWLMLQQDSAEDYVVATGQGRTVRDFLDAAFGAVGLNWRELVSVDPQFYRASDPYPMIGDASKARTQLGWAPRRSFGSMVADMVEQDLRCVS